MEKMRRKMRPTAAKPDPPPMADLARRAVTLALRTAAPMLGGGDEARDVAQDVALIVLRRHGQVRDFDRFDAWVHRIAVRESLRAVRQRQQRVRHERPLEAGADPTPAAAVAPPDDDRVLTRMATATALQRLPPRERIALILRYVHDLSDEEIATALQCRRGTVGSLLSRGRERLRQTPEIESLSTPAIAWSPPNG